MAAKKYKWPGEKVARHSQPAKGDKPKANTNRPGGKKPAKAGGKAKKPSEKKLQQQLGRRTTDASRQRFLKKHKMRDPDLTDPNYFQRPQTLGQANIEADRATALRYGGQEQELRNESELIGRQGRQIPAWFDQYRANIAQAQQQSAQMAAPVIAQAQQTAQAVGQSTLPQGQAVPPEVAQRDAQAAASRQALAQSFASLLGANQQSTSNYFAGRQGVAGAAQIGLVGENAMKARQAQQAQTQLAGEKGDFRAGQLAQTRDKERQYGLERSAFGLDVEKAKAGEAAKAQAAASKRGTERRERQAERRKLRQDRREFGVTRADKLAKERRADKLARERLELDKKKAREKKSGGGSSGLTPVQRRAAKRESQKAITRITNARGLWGDYARQTVEVNGKRRKPTPSEIKARLRSEGYNSTEIHLMLVHRAGKRWSPKDRQDARRLGIRIRDL